MCYNIYPTFMQFSSHMPVPKEHPTRVITKFSMMSMEILTYNLCYTNVRCTRATSVVAPLIYASLCTDRARYVKFIFIWHSRIETISLLMILGLPILLDRYRFVYLGWGESKSTDDNNVVKFTPLNANMDDVSLLHRPFLLLFIFGASLHRF